MRNSFRAGGTGISFHFGKKSFVLNAVRVGAAAVVLGDANVDTVDVPHRPRIHQ